MKSGQDIADPPPPHQAHRGTRRRRNINMLRASRISPRENGEQTYRDFRRDPGFEAFEDRRRGTSCGTPLVERWGITPPHLGRRGAGIQVTVPPSVEGHSPPVCFFRWIYSLPDRTR
ncbi:unnamed protein product [Diplocarpon coronariae]|uniref:Uncharacterized protein n=1 Tax=Diplocarpon coronariae TaxID=2795749 RepID=A0A218Z183_9HELO|nr:hypothetical protein JHW43_005926 [Diplocarpon mali]OWP01464.1 hypothetical protein B2J93_696 [Marssonina coronariae]